MSVSERARQGGSPGLGICLPVLALMSGFVTGRSAAQEPLRQVTCYRLAGRAVVDGDLSDEAWQHLPAVSGFYSLGDGFAPEQTELRLGWTDECLCLAFRCAEPAMDGLVVTLKDGEPLWMEDCVEVFLQPVPGPYFQFDLNLLSSRTGFCAAQGRHLGEMEVAGQRGLDEWTLEARLPFGIVEATPTERAAWRGNFCRIRYAGGANGTSSSVAPMQQSNHEPDRFARILFSARTLTPAEADELARRDPVGATGRSPLRRQGREALRAGRPAGRPYEQSATEIREAAQTPQFQSEAQALVQELDQVQTLHERLDAASLSELTRALALARTCAERAEDLRYSVLLLRLLGD